MKNHLRLEFIGKQVAITKASNPSIACIKGKIIDETKNTFIIQTTTGRKRVLKKGNQFSLTLGKETHNITGDDIIATPEERVKL